MTLEQLLQKLADGDKYIRLQKDVESYRTELTLFPKFWRLYKYALRKINFDWGEFRYSSNSLPSIPEKTPGVYLFVVRPPGYEVVKSIFDPYSVVMYVGISNEGLLERFSKGYRMPSTVSKRPHIHRMILQYSDYLYWYYCPIDSSQMVWPPINRTIF